MNIPKLYMGRSVRWLRVATGWYYSTLKGDQPRPYWSPFYKRRYPDLPGELPGATGRLEAAMAAQEPRLRDAWSGNS